MIDVLSVITVKLTEAQLRELDRAGMVVCAEVEKNSTVTGVHRISATHWQIMVRKM